MYTVGFILALLCFICSMNAIILPIMLSDQGQPFVLAGILISIAVLSGFLFSRVIKRVKVRHRQPISECNILCTIDLDARSLCDGEGRFLASLDEVSLRRQFQFGSSSPAYSLVWTTGKRLIVRGNPFAGGAGGVVDALKRHGIPVQ